MIASGTVSETHHVSIQAASPNTTVAWVDKEVNLRSKQTAKKMAGPNHTKSVFLEIIAYLMTKAIENTLNFNQWSQFSLQISLSRLVGYGFESVT